VKAAAAAAEADAKAARMREEVLALRNELKAKESARRVKALEQIAARGAEASDLGEELIEAMADKAPEVRRAASEALEKVNPKVHPHVVTILFGMNKAAGVAGLQKLGTEASIAVPLLLALIEHPPMQIPFNGTRLAPIPLGDLYAAAASVGPKDARVAATILATVARPVPRTDAARPSLIGPRLAVRLRALRQVGRIEATADEKVKAVVAALGDGWGQVELIQALEAMGKDAAAALPVLKQLKLSSDDAVRKAAARAVEKIE
jgi:hypothetical protein